MKQKQSGQECLAYTSVLFLQIDLLEKDVLEVLGSVRSMKNDFAPINRIPGAVLSLIPNYWEHQYIDTSKDLVMLTHVCRSWRNLFISRPSLWTNLDFKSVNKTRIYIERSRSLLLEATLCKTKAECSLEEALLLAVPHIRRFKSLTIIGITDPLQNLTKHLTSPAPSLKELIIDFSCTLAPALNINLLNGDLSSLNTLTLGGVATRLPWKNLQNLTAFKLRCAPDSGVTVKQLLGFLENAQNLRDITLHDSIPTSSNVCTSRVVPLGNLKTLTISGGTGYGVLLNHLHIPDGASLVLDFNFGEKKPFIGACLPKTSKNFRNLFRITAVNLYFGRERKCVLLVGPNGALYMIGHREGEENLTFWDGPVDRQILQSLDYFKSRLHEVRSLTITEYNYRLLTGLHGLTPFDILPHMNGLHTLTLIRCKNLDFIAVLNPGCVGRSKIMFLPNLKELILYVEARSGFYIEPLMIVAKERALRGAGLKLVTIVGLGELLPGKEVFKLREHVGRVEYRVEENPPEWDSTPYGTSG